MPFSTKIIKLINKVDEPLRDILIAILEEIEEQSEKTVTKKEFNELKDIVNQLSNNINKLTESVKDLAFAQKKTEEKLENLTDRVNQLAEAQIKTEERLDKLTERLDELTERVNQLAEAQKKTEQRLDELTERVNQLAEAQKKTEQRLDELTERVNQLAEAQKKTEQRLDELTERVNQLAEAQKKTENELKKLIDEHKKTREQLGGLSHTVGYILEDRSYYGLPKLLKRDFNLEIISPIKREYIEISPGKYFEINIIGKGKINNKEYYILGEAKTQLKKRDINNFLSKIKLIEHFFPNKIYILVTYQTSPQVVNYAKEKGIKVYFSYEMPLITF